MAESDGITGISLNGVRKLIEDRQLPEDLLDAFDTLFGAAIALSPLVAGPAGIALWPLLEPKDALVSAAKSTIKKLTRSRPCDYMDQARRFAAANTLLTFTAFFDALQLSVPDLTSMLDLSEADKRRMMQAVAARAAGGRPPYDKWPFAYTNIEVPHPAALHAPAGTEFRVQLYRKLGTDIFARLNEGDFKGLPKDMRTELVEHLTVRAPVRAESVYQAEFLGIAIDYQPFFVWSTLQDQASKDKLLRKLDDELSAAGEDSQLRFELLGAALHNLDLGLDRLSRAIAAQPSPSPDGPRHPDSKAARAAEALRRRYAADIRRPVIDDRYDPPMGSPRLRYPGSAAAYVPQAYRQVRYSVGKTHLELDDMWADLPVAEDLGPAITRYLESPYSAETPLLILGHPGSGKSLLTRVYAARLEYPRYTVVRVELRDADPTVSVQKQVEDQIYKDTSYEINWADLADNLPMSPPVVILDGYDELLQATGKLFTDYLDQVQRFQQNALVQNRPVRVIITSRITLIDKAIVPPGTAVMRLEPFDEPRRTEWISRWNASNAAYFQQVGIKPFRLPDNPKLMELAEQPLLLLMLAIFDSEANALSERPDLDQTLLYEDLLHRFIERELGKGEHGTAFSGLRPEERRPLVERELIRLGVAAIGMFNRQEVKILRDQLDKDLAYFGAERPVTSDLYGQSQSELLLGSFFFIHESRSRLAVNQAANGAQHEAGTGKPVPAGGTTAFEFLHNTFGEFLAADFILRHVVKNAETIRDLTGKPTLEYARQQHLSTLTPHWFASLLYTPLHTRPNILTLLREWSVHRLPADPAARSELLTALDAIIHTQLRTVLAGIGPLDPTARARAVPAGETVPTSPPYDPLPVFGHVAVYTLNLILLRTYLADGTYTLDEPAMDAGVRPWDRLTALWRSWFTAESLGTLANQFTAVRVQARLNLEPVASALAVLPDSPLAISYNAAVALADDLTAASAGLHVASLTTFGEERFNALVEGFPAEASALTPIAEAMLARVYESGRRVIGDHAEGALRRVSHVSPEFTLRFAEVIDRVALNQEIGVDAPVVQDIAQLSRYQAELLVHASMRFHPLWLQDLLSLSHSGDFAGEFPAGPPRVWRSFLTTPAAAPVLCAAVREVSADPLRTFGETVLRGLSGRQPELFDADTAAALAGLAWCGSVTELFLLAVDVLLRECGRGRWQLMDIRREIWPVLADALRTPDPEIQGRRREFAAILDAQLERFFPDFEEVHVWRLQLIELWLHALRIGAAKRSQELLGLVVPWATGGAPTSSLFTHESRQWFLLLLRWAHENGEKRFVNEILSGSFSRPVGPWWMHFGAGQDDGPWAIDVARASAGLTYREAADLRWALALWRKSGAHWNGQPPTQTLRAKPASPGSPASPRRARSRKRSVNLGQE